MSFKNLTWLVNVFVNDIQSVSHDGSHHASHEHDRRSPDVDIFEQLKERLRELGFDGRTVSETLKDQLESDG